jgi:hypothetical protein
VLRRLAEAVALFALSAFVLLVTRYLPSDLSLSPEEGEEAANE